MLNGDANKKLFAIFYIVCAVTALLINRCQKSSDPKMALSGYLDAVITGNYKEAYDFFSFEDRSVKSLTEFMKEHELSAAEIDIVNMSKDYIMYDIKKVSVMDDSAKAIVKITMPEIMVKQFKPLLPIISRQRRIDSLIDPRNNKKFSIITLTGSVLMMKEFNGWRVYGNWEEQRKKEAEESKIRLKYIQSQLKIKNVKIREYQGDRRTYLTATIKNLGQKTLKEVVVFVVCLNKDNKACYSVTEQSISETVKPISPKASRKIKIDLTNAPPDWSRRVEISVVNCKFAR